MESRRPLHQSDNGKGRMVSHRSIVDLSRLPLLPFERELVATLGCSEAEYRAFTVEAMKRSQVRPAEYDGVPDIQNYIPGVTESILISLAIGLVTSAISFLLMPKPKQQSESVRELNLTNFVRDLQLTSKVDYVYSNRAWLSHFQK